MGMISAADLTEWLADFCVMEGALTVTCNGAGLLASDAEGYHYFTLVGYTDEEINLMFDALTPYL